jgi:protein-S-isoprenylcysteine O-methyltransferase Ste14
MAAIATSVCWGLVIVTWIAGALYWGRGSRHTRRGSARAVWAIGLTTGAILVARLTWRDVAWPTDRSAWIELPGLVLLVVSTAFTIWARFRLGRMWSASPNVLQEGHALRTNGPYAVTRHPIYTGLPGMAVGTVLLNGLGASVVVLFVAAVFLATRIAIEERLMSETFPDEYARYRERMPLFVPGLRLLRRSH